MAKWYFPFFSVYVNVVKYHYFFNVWVIFFRTEFNFLQLTFSSLFSPSYGLSNESSLDKFGQLRIFSEFHPHVKISGKISVFQICRERIHLKAQITAKTVNWMKITEKLILLRKNHSNIYYILAFYCITAKNGKCHISVKTKDR